MTSWFNRFLLPGFVFQSVCIAGGYGTGRELVEFFLKFGPGGGLLGMIPATLLMSVGCAIALELARQARSYDYRSFLKVLLGRGWVAYELAFVVVIFLVLAVISSATDSLFRETFGLPGGLGALMLLVTVGFLAFRGTKLIEKVLSAWSFVLYAAYITLFILCLKAFGPAIQQALSEWQTEPGWLVNGFRYGTMQLSMVPVILFAATHLTCRRDAFVAGLLAGPILMIPALLFFTAMLSHYPEILQRPVPVNHLLELLHSPWLLWVFPIVLIGTFIETGVGLIHAFNERLAQAFTSVGRTFPQAVRPLVAVGLILAALLLSRLGIIDLIAIGYGTLAWVFIVIFTIPLLTIGAWKVFR